MSTLRVRLRNCIQTILELEPVILTNNGILFEEEFIYLKKYLKCVENMELAEDEVSQLEKVTSEFLDDMRNLNLGKTLTGHILQ